MNLLNFVSQYPDEARCRIKFKEIMDKKGNVCPRCGHGDHCWKKGKESYECKKCGKRQSLQANTVMHDSQLPFHYWFITIHLLTVTRDSFSVSKFQHQSGHKYCEPVWTMLHKLRIAMDKRDEAYDLSGILELGGEGFSTELDEEEKDKPLKRDCGSQKKSKVSVMTESEPTADNNSKPSSKNSFLSGKKPRNVGHIRMTVVDDLKSGVITLVVEVNVSKEPVIDSDGSTSYGKLKEIVKEYHPQVIPKENVGKVLPWVHIAISNAKKQSLDIYHQIDPLYLQNYLNEFCYKFNRRYFEECLFERLMIVAVVYKNKFRCNAR